LLSLRDATLRFGPRTLWRDVTVDIAPGEFVAVLGANGSGKTSLMRVLLGQLDLSSGAASFLDAPVRRGDRRIGYIPQHKLADGGAPTRGRDLVGLGLDGHRWGFPLPSRERRARVDRALEQVGASAYANVPVGVLSGGEQQRLRVGQALASDPQLLLCDEPLLSLDLAHQRTVSELIDGHRREHGTGVLFVTHDVNPVLDMVDRVLYLASGRFVLGSPDEVFQSHVMSDLYGAPVDVIRVRGRVIVVGTPEGHEAHHHEHEPGL